MMIDVNEITFGCKDILLCLYICIYVSKSCVLPACTLLMMTMFPGPNGHLSSLDIYPGGHYEVHGNDPQPVAESPKLTI